MKLRPYQTRMMENIMRELKTNQRTLAVAATGTGKCLARGTPVLMWDGRIVLVQDVREGDWLMGPDNYPRKVLSLASGREEMFRVTPKKGDPYTVNRSHILSLKMTKVHQHAKGRIVNISVDDYLKSNRNFKHCAKGWRCGVRDFPSSHPLRLDPYFVGVWLGDGASKSVSVTSGDKEIVHFLYWYAGIMGLRIREENNSPNSKNYHLVSERGVRGCRPGANFIRSELQRLRMLNNKHIPHEYRTASRNERLQLLAGIIDTDGSRSDGGFEITLSSQKLASDVVFVARSLGMAAYVKPCKKTCVNNGVVGDYWRIFISGNTAEVPCLIPRKKCDHRRQKKDVLVHGISVESGGIGEYFGFTVDRDGLFMLGDFTVTHNTVCFAHVAKHFLQYGRVMVLAHRDELIQQACGKLRVITGVLPTVEKADQWSHEESMHGKPPLVVSSIQTQSTGRMNRFKPSDFSLVIADEAHHVCAASWTKVLNHYASNPNCKILGLTATPDRSDGELLGQMFQSIADSYTLNDAISDGYLVPVKPWTIEIEGLDFSKVHTLAGDFNQGELEDAMMFEEPLHGVAHATIEAACGFPEGTLRQYLDDPNRRERVRELLNGRTPKKCLVFCVSVAHAERMAEIFQRWIVGSAEVVSGKLDDFTRGERLKSFAKGELRFLCNCMIATEGFDEPSIEMVIMARPTKSRSLYVQMLGRGTRPLDEIATLLGDLDSDAERLAMIAASDKPHLSVLDFVGNTGRHEVVTTIDIFGDGDDQDVIDRAKEIAADGEITAQDALDQSREEVERKRREAEIRKREREEKLRKQAQEATRQQLVGVGAYKKQEVADWNNPPEWCNVQPKHRNILSKAKVPMEDIRGMNDAQIGQLCRKIVMHWQMGLCSYRQAKVLHKAGWEKEELSSMTFGTASASIDALARNGWKRPMVTA